VKRLSILISVLFIAITMQQCTCEHSRIANAPVELIYDDIYWKDGVYCICVPLEETFACYYFIAAYEAPPRQILDIEGRPIPCKRIKKEKKCQ
jgi:hypothetical protein